ncbi:DUF87 domain-containing protein [Frankia sp. Ag45/Mut15]|uniref:DUF87 domain-containing protein n=1 Tax=Frankia umida TaxID=573489 RepID=A0ABT0JZ41_9ACTN|nr:DUF87 domain-containing protein [Frankia umida]MCK9876549.1 DUF87 domain-containing protein [Frankia umida]
MDSAQRTALDSIQLTWAPVPDDVWRSLSYHVDGLHPGVVQAVEIGLREAADSADASPIGLVLQGQRGSGKTHLLGWLRREAQEQGGYFFLVSLLSTKDIWVSILTSMLDGLARPMADGETQLRVLLRRLSARVGVPPAERRALLGETELTKEKLDLFISAISASDGYVFRTSRDTARALALSASPGTDHQNIADDYFACDEESTPGDRAFWGMRRTTRTAEEIVQELSRLIALTGPSVMAFDQIDVLLSQSNLLVDSAAAGSEPSHAPSQAQLLLLDSIAGGLMTLRERTRRTLTVVACIPGSWDLIKKKAVDTVRDRFREAPQLKSINRPDLAREIVAQRFKPYFAAADFDPPYPTWPIHPDAFSSGGDFTPRQLLILIDAHIRACRLRDEATEMRTLKEKTTGPPLKVDPDLPTISTTVLARYDERFAELKHKADVITPLEPDTEDTAVPPLLAAGLTAWILERPDSPKRFSIDPAPSGRPDLHARLRLTLAEDIEDEVHWCFRAVSGGHHGNAALNRLRRSITAAALDPEISKRKLFLLRQEDWSTGAKTRESLDVVEASHGDTLALDHEDLRILSALRTMLDEDRSSPSHGTSDLGQWLLARRPTETVTVLGKALRDVADWLPPEASATVTRPKDTPTEATSVADTAGSTRTTGTTGTTPLVRPTLDIGHDHATAEPVALELEALRKHLIVIAGSGSGKTVLLRRIVEECALRGVSAIVLDPNNDLARLGDAWPEPPSLWGADDGPRAVEYLDNTEVVVWTPRREAGRTLSFQPLPDFPATLADPDEFAEAVEVAVAALVPRAMLDGRAAKAHLGRAVLRRAVEHFGHRGGTRLTGLISLLADLPADIIDLDGAEKIAAGLAQTLSAAMVNDPLFGGSGTPADPGVLLTPAAGKRARISVISFVGLPDEGVRQSFVNQLQMALFSWIKKNPAVDRPLLGLLVMDEAQTFVPSGAMTACTQSTLALASQARKYGLGLVFATQAPRALHNRVPGNAATQMYGLLNSPTQVEVAREMAKAKGGDVPDISRLRTGEFYVALEGEAPRKIRTPLSLSYHPRGPLTTEEVVARARQ